MHTASFDGFSGVLDSGNLFHIRDIMTPPIAILGAGPSGLTLGRLLELANIPYIIFERDISAASTFTAGGTLDIHADSGQLALQEAGLIDQFKELAREDAPFALADAKGKIHTIFGEDGRTDRPEIDRKDLRALLLSSVPADRVRWGLRAQNVKRDTDGSMSVHFTNGSVELGFSLVVGADGVWSRARPLVSWKISARALLMCF